MDTEYKRVNINNMLTANVKRNGMAKQPGKPIVVPEHGIIIHKNHYSSERKASTPRGIHMDLKAEMQVQDEEPKDALWVFHYDKSYVPKLKFDLPNINSTAYFYEHEDWIVNTDEATRMSERIVYMTAKYPNATCYCRTENEGEYLTCRCEHYASVRKAPKVKHFNMSSYMHHLVDHHKKKITVPKVSEAEMKRRKEQATKKVEEERAKKAEENEKRKEFEASKAWKDCFTNGDCEFGAAPAKKKVAKNIPGPLPPTVDFGPETDKPLVDTCDHDCSVTTLGNYTVCYAACQVKLCALRRRKAVSIEARIMDQLAQVGEALSTTADASLYQARRETSEVYHTRLVKQRKQLVQAQASAIKMQKEAELCHGKWTAQKTKQQVALHTEIERQRHLTRRETFERGDLSHLEDDALAARLRAARRVHAHIKDEYERMTGEAVADSKGDAAAAKCFLKKTNERKELDRHLKQNSDQLTRATERLRNCKVDPKRDGCDADSVMKLQQIEKDLTKQLQSLRKKWAGISECVMQHDCARVKLEVLKKEIAQANKLDEEASPMDMKNYMGKVPLVPHVIEKKEQKFNYNNLLNENRSATADTATGAEGPTGIRGFSSEDEAETAYDEKTIEMCKSSPNPITFTLIKGKEFNADDTIYVRVSCNSSDPESTTGVWTSSNNPRNATNADGTEVSDIIWHQETNLLTADGAATMNANAQCYMHVYGCEEPACLGSPPAHNKNAFVETLQLPVRKGKSSVHVTKHCGGTNPAGCGVIEYSMVSKCLSVKHLLNHSFVEQHRQNIKNEEENKEGELSKILNGDATSLLEKYSDRHNIEAERKGTPFYMLKEHLISGTTEDWRNIDVKYPNIAGVAGTTIKREMLQRDVDTIEAWLNATAGRAESDRGNYTEALRRKSDVDEKQVRASKVVRCLNLARGTPLFATLEKQLIKEGIIKVTKDQRGFPKGFEAKQSPLQEACAQVESGSHFADALGMNAQFMEVDESEYKYNFNARMERAAKLDFVSFLENAESRISEGKSMTHEHMAKVQWELKQVSELLSEKGINDKVTANSPVANRLSPSTYAMVVARDQLSAELQNGGASGMRFREGMAMSQSAAMLHDAVHIDHDDFAMLVNATLSCLCYGNGVNGHALEGEVSSSCGEAPTPYPVSMKFHSTPVFPLSHLPPSRNELAERKRAEMRKRLHKVQLELEKKIEALTEESRKRAEQTTSDMKETLSKLHTRRIKLNEQTIKYRKWLKEKVEMDKLSMHNKKVKFNITLHEIMKQREELFKKQEEEDHKLEEKKKQHMRNLEKMRQDEEKLEDDMRLQDQKSQEAWRREQDRLDDLYIQERSRRDKLALGYAQSSEKYRLEIMQKQRMMRGAYESELNKLETLRNNVLQGGQQELSTDKSRSASTLRGRVPYIKHGGSGLAMSSEEMKSEEERENGNRRGAPVASPNARFPKYWKYGKSANRFANTGNPVWVPLPCSGTVSAGSTSVQTTCDLRGKVERGEAIRLGRQVFHIPRTGGEFSDKVMPLNAPAGSEMHQQSILKLLPGTGGESYKTVEVGCYKETLDRSSNTLRALEGEMQDAMKASAQARKHDAQIAKQLKDIESKKAAAADKHDTDPTVLRQQMKEFDEQLSSLKEQKQSADAREQNLNDELAKAKESASKAEAIMQSKSGGSKTPDNVPSVLSFQADINADDLTPQKCAAACYKISANFTYAGVKGGKYCLCGHEFNSAEKASPTSCATPCPGDARESCGGVNYVAVYNYTAGLPPAGMSPDEACAEAQDSACKRNATHVKSLLDHARKEVDAERRKWEEAVVRLSRPKTCKQLQGLATGGGDGMYTIFPPEHTTFGSACADEKGQGYSDECARIYKGVETYCDMTTDGGGWTLVGYATHGKLNGRLVTTNGKFDARNRRGSANLNGLWIAQASREMAFSWNPSYSASENLDSTAGLDSYQKVLKFDIPNPTHQTVAPELHDSKSCDSSTFSRTTVACLKGQCNMPREMYTGTDSLGVCSGHAYGLVASPNKGACDWSVNSQKYNAFYVSVDDTPRCVGIVDKNRKAGSNDAEIPSTVAIWVR